jgi:Domain of unknown function (DUF4129)
LNRNFAVRSPLKLAAAMLLLGCGTLRAASPEPAAAGVAPSREEVQAAVATLRLDPNLGHERHTRTLRWVDSKAPPPADAPMWLVGLFNYLGRAGSLVIWVLGAIAAAIAIVWSFRFLKARTPSIKLARPRAVSHVGELDIRPDSLPEDVGAAALELLNADRVREALSLLYRGALSRAVHGFGVSIQESHTEGEALRVVVAGLDAARADYFRELVGLWQAAVYAGQPIPTAPVAALSSQFAATLGTPV